ncbi:hypothetical protein [Dyadobacter sp. 676]|uniref:Uncharacterized protein n=1 Tax=Dyadobacter sp. 676 TaxID=3088362 RepID=A0AAU8FQH3_9BACT
MVEYSGDTAKNGTDQIDVKKFSELGNIVTAISRPIPWTQKIERPQGEGVIAINYYSHTLSHEVSNDRLAMIAKGMDHIFHRSLIPYVSALHDLLSGDYSPHVNSFLEIYGIQRDVDVEFETLRKVYRDRIDRLNRQRRKSYA